MKLGYERKEKAMSNRALSILCIDDDEFIRYALSQMCQSQQWKAYTAQNVAEGLEIFDTTQIDLVLIDYHLPDLNGVEGVRLLRKRSTEVPIIVFTIDDNQEVADAFLQAGANDFALKPIKALDLISRIKLHIRLMDSERQNLYGESGRKGVSYATVNLILQCLRSAGKDMTVGEIAEATGLANQTAYRYLQHMAGDQLVTAEKVYGKVGRPKQVFRAGTEEFK